MTNEIWENLLGYQERYQISSLGRVKSYPKPGIRKKEIILKPMMYLRRNENNDGYTSVALYLNGKRKYFKIHRLVAITFIPNPKNKPFVNHKNGIKKDNEISNLEWVTASENTIHAHKAGLMVERTKRQAIAQSGEKASNAKLSWKIIMEIRKEKKCGKSQTKLAQDFGVSASTISSIINQRSWKEERQC